jgi:tetrahydromethanopterin S-methyltransferase subunit G
MQPDAKAMEIAGKFANFLTSSDEALIEGITEDEIERTLTLYVREKGRQAFYDAMERRLEKLREKRKKVLSDRERTKERWLGRVEGTVGGIVVGVIVVIIGLMIQSHFFPNIK